MSIVLAHRGNTSGPHPAAEDVSVSIARALSQGWGIAVDVSLGADGRFRVTHEPGSAADGCPAEAVLRLLRAHPGAMAAIGATAPGSHAALVRLLDAERVLGQAFLVGMDRFEARAGETARHLRRLHPRVHLAARVSDRGEPLARALDTPQAGIIWLEEFDGPWCTQADVQRLKQAGRLVIAVSPERHGASPATTGRRWAEFIEWGVDGVCTDYPAAFARVSASLAPPVAVRVAA